MKSVRNVLAALAAILLFPAAGAAQAPIDQIRREWDLAIGPQEPPHLPYASRNYGPDRQPLSILPGRRGRGAPLVVLLPGPSRLSGPTHYTSGWLQHYLYEQGFALAVVGHRRSHVLPVAELAEQMALGIAELAARAARHGYDAGRIVLVGNGWAGHVAALLATDPSYLEGAGVPFEALRAAVVLDWSCFDLADGAETASGQWQRELIRIGGEDAESRRRASPAAHLASPNAPAFLFHVLRTEPDAVEAVERMAAALRETGSRSEVIAVAPNRPGVPATYLGAPQNQGREALLGFVREATQ